MRNQETIANRIVRNINYALEAIPRALTLEKEKSVRKIKRVSKMAGKKSKGIRAKSRRLVAKTARKARPLAKRSTKTTMAATAKRRIARAAKVVRMRPKSRKLKGRSTYVAPSAHAA